MCCPGRARACGARWGPSAGPAGRPIVLALIAVVLLSTALSLRARLKAQRERRPGAKGVDPLMAARAVVFGQAAPLVAALVSGMYGGTGAFLLESLDIPARRDQAIYAGSSVLASIAVVAAAFLERVCRPAGGRRQRPRRRGPGRLTDGPRRRACAGAPGDQVGGN